MLTGLDNCNVWFTLCNDFRGFLPKVGIYPDAIVDVITLCEETVKEVEPKLMVDFWSIYDDIEPMILSGMSSNLTNRLITALYESLQEFIKQYVSENLDMSYYVNGEDSHFYIDNEDLINIDVSTLKEE